MALKQSDIGDLYLWEEMKALRCIRKAVDCLDDADPVGFGFWLEEAQYHSGQMTSFKRRFEIMIAEELGEENEARGR